MEISFLFVDNLIRYKPGSVNVGRIMLTHNRATPGIDWPGAKRTADVRTKMRQLMDRRRCLERGA